MEPLLPLDVALVASACLARSCSDDSDELLPADDEIVSAATE